jgi:hypothetical protein
MPSHSWERERPQHAWDHAADDDSDWDGDALSPGHEFVEYVLNLVRVRQISDKECCTIMHYAFSAGISEAHPYKLNPESPSGHFSRKLKAALGHTAANPDLYELDFPGHCRRTAERVVTKTWTLPGHEHLALDISEDPSCRTRLYEMRRDRELPPVYWQHPTVQENPDEPVYPIAFYLDGVSYSNTDTVLGLWLVNLVTNVRYCMATIRKRMLCQCGCRGWCSFYVIFRYIAWIIVALRRGMHPTDRHDQSAWRASDHKRAALAGNAIPKCACIYIKGDWCEYAGPIGFANWQDALRPCFECNCFGLDMYCSAGNSIRSLRWRPNGEHDYDDACSACEVIVLVSTNVDLTLIFDRLRSDKSDNGSHGRVLTRDLPMLRLSAGDRLEPSASLPDVGLFQNASLPFEATFWRPSLETLTRHRNPLFCDATGMHPSRCITIDTLHTFCLAVLNVWAKLAMWQLLLSGVFGKMHYADEMLKAAAMVCKNALFSWYKKRHADKPHERLTHLSDLTHKMLGSKDAPKLKAKAAECWGVALFLIDQLALHADRVGADGQRLLQAGRHLAHMVTVWHSFKWIVPEQEQEDIMASYNAHVALMAPFTCYTPKHHLMYHLVQDTGYLGNPDSYACWLDESLNRQLKLCCRNVSQSTFECSVLLSMRDLLKPSSSRKRGAD